MMRTLVLAAALAVVLSSTPAAAQPPCQDRVDAPTPGDPNMLAQFATGVFGQMLGGLVGGGIFALALETGDANVARTTGGMGILIASAASAGAVTLVGDSNGGDGTFWAALGGQVAGGALASLLAMALIGQGGSDAMSLEFWAAFASVLTLPPAGAAIAYDLSDRE
jgi:hypothetical protein